MSNRPLIDQTAVVTGAAGGFGRAIVAALAGHGAHVVGVGRTGGPLHDLRRELDTSFTPFVADVRDPELGPTLLAEFRPAIVVLNAGAVPHAASLSEHDWESFSVNWHTDVHQAFQFSRAALRLPLAAGSTVISVSSGAARRGSPLSGGYAGAKATVGFINAYAADESARSGLGIRFTALLPQLTPATPFGSTFVDAYATLAGLPRAAYLDQLGAPLMPAHVADAVVRIVTGPAANGASFLVTAESMTELA